MAADLAGLAALLILLAARPAEAKETERSEAPAPVAAQRVDAGLPRRCGVCHLDKAPSPGPGRIVFAAPRGADGAGAAGMCFSCHSGIVDDRRRQLGRGRHHPASGKVSCGSCHTPHVQEANVGTFMRYPSGSFAYCTACHPGRGDGASGEHPAVAREKGRPQDCGSCHAVHGAQGEGLIQAGSGDQLCIPCHGDNPSVEGRGPGMASHPTAEAGLSCLGCHGAHRTAGGRALLGKAAFEGRLCRQCHERSYSPASGDTNHPISAGGASCLSCHRMHNAEKRGARRGLLAVPWEAEDEICRRCHAGLAATNAGEGAWNHPVGGSVAADERSFGSSLVRSGAFFAPGGRMTCLSCHRAHGGLAGSPQLLAAREALCLYCHPAQNSLDPEQAALGAHPVSVRPRKARIGAAFISAGGATGPQGEIICLTCHRTHSAQPGTPGLVLPRESYSCLLCHSREAAVASTPHSSARAPGSGRREGTAGLCGGCHGEHGWRLPPGKPEQGQTAIERICLSCHGGGTERLTPLATNHPLGVAPRPGSGSGGLPLFWNDGRRYRLGVVTCATCHDPHRAGADGRFLRVGLAGESHEQCLGCHRAQETVIDTPHDGSPAGGATCGPCHPVHDPLGVASWPGIRGGERTTVDLAGFCGGCHGPGGAASGKAVGGRMHPESVLPGKSAVSCGGCHDPHRWDPRDPADRGGHTKGDARTSFLVQPADANAPLCAECHPGETAVVGTPHDFSLPGLGTLPPDIPDPERHGLCAACHKVHPDQSPGSSGAQAPTSGAGEGPVPAGDPCERCHAEGGIAANSSPGAGGHPVGISAGQDFGPDLPLFGGDGRRQPRGRIGCATCHDPHRRAPVSGSGSGSKAATSFLRFGADGFSPLCFPCHPEESMVVGTDHDLRVTAPHAVNLAGEDAEASGVCGACHAMHGPSAGQALWNRGEGEGWDWLSRVCTGCHRANNDMGAHVPPRTETHLVNYPGRGLVRRLFTPARAVSSGPQGITLFAEDGTRAEQGYLSCASCHDIHRWESGASTPGSGVHVEGNHRNSFLRVKPAALERTLCAECHGSDLAERYRNFHFPEGR